MTRWPAPLPGGRLGWLGIAAQAGFAGDDDGLAALGEVQFGQDVPAGPSPVSTTVTAAHMSAWRGRAAGTATAVIDNRKAWGPAAGIAFAVANVISAVIGGIAGWDGWTIGLGVSVVATILVVVSESGALRGHSVAAAD